MRNIRETDQANILNLNKLNPNNDASECNEIYIRKSQTTIKIILKNQIKDSFAACKIIWAKNCYEIVINIYIFFCFFLSSLSNFKFDDGSGSDLYNPTVNFDDFRVGFDGNGRFSLGFAILWRKSFSVCVHTLHYA